MGMSGGGTTKTVSEPWTGAQPYLRQAFGMAQNAAGQLPQFYPGQTFAGPQAGQMAGWDAQLGYTDQVFGGQNAPKFGAATDALTKQLSGNDPLSSFMSTMGPFGTAGGLDARGAIQSSLSGTPDYKGLEGAITAANAPLLRQFNEELIPSLNQRTIFTNNPTGAIKSLNTALPQLADRMSENALSLTNDERIRALNSRDSTANMVSQGGLQYGNLYGNLASSANDARARAIGLFPSLAQTGAIPGQLASQFGDWAAQFPQQQVAENVDRWNFNQNAARDNAQWYINAINGMAGLGGTQTNKGGGGGVGGALGGAAGGAIAGNQIVPGGWGAAIGGGIGLLGGLL